MVISNGVPLPNARTGAGGLAMALRDAVSESGGVWLGWSGERIRDGKAEPHSVRQDGRNTPSGRAYRPPEEPEYPFHDRSVRVTNRGRICLGKRKISLSRAMANQIVSITEVSEKIWLVSFLEYDLGFFDQDQDRVEPAQNPFTPKVLPVSSV